MEALLNYIGKNDFNLLKTEFPDKWKYLTEKIAHPNEFFNCIEDYQKPVDIIKKEDFFSKLKNDYLSDEGIQRNKGNYQNFRC